MHPKNDVHIVDLARELGFVDATEGQDAVGDLEFGSRLEGDTNDVRVNNTLSKRVVGDCRDGLAA